MRIAYSLTLCLVFALCLPGCNQASKRSYSKPETVDRGIMMGFGQGESQNQAKQKAWDDAITRIKSVGIEDFHIISFRHPSGGQRNGVYYTEVMIDYEVTAPISNAQLPSTHDDGLKH